MADTIQKFGPTQGNSAEQILYTAPAAGAVVRQIHICNSNSSAETFKMSIGADGAGTRLFKDYAVAANDFCDWTGFLPMTSGETLRWTATTQLVVRGGVIEQ